MSDNYLRDLRGRLGISQACAAGRIGVHRVTWTRWETGASTPSFEMIARIAKLAGHSVGTVARRLDLMVQERAS